MPRKTDARENAIRTASRLFQSQGFHGTGLAQIIAESGCPKGSFYHHFPRGKEQLALEAIALANKRLAEIFDNAERRSNSTRKRTARPSSQTEDANTGGVESYVDALIRGLARWAEESDYTEGCPIVSLTLETSATPSPLRNACRDSYRSWRERVANGLRACGMGTTAATDSASAVVSAINGAMVVARAERSTRPFRDLAGVLRAAFTAVVAPRRER